MFDSALHYASAFLTTQGHRPQNHHQRNSMVCNMTDAGADYHNLYRLSLNTRYRGMRYTLQQADAVKTGPFRRVKEEILALLPS